MPIRVWDWSMKVSKQYTSGIHYQAAVKLNLENKIWYVMSHSTSGMIHYIHENVKTTILSENEEMDQQTLELIP